MKLERHIEKLKEHVSGLEWGIRQNNSSSVGFHASAGSVELLSILLHKLELISPGFQINHTWFRSKSTIETKFSFDFPKKTEIITILEEIEDLRDPLCYGAPESERMEMMTEGFHKLKGLVEGITGETCV